MKNGKTKNDSMLGVQRSAHAICNDRFVLLSWILRVEMRENIGSPINLPTLPTNFIELDTEFENMLRAVFSNDYHMIPIKFQSEKKLVFNY